LGYVYNNTTLHPTYWRHDSRMGGNKTGLE
jgi:hypothetical protein